MLWWHRPCSIRSLASGSVWTSSTLSGLVRASRAVEAFPRAHLPRSFQPRTARILDVQTRRETAVLQGHTNPVTSAVFGSEGQRVITAS